MANVWNNTNVKELTDDKMELAPALVWGVLKLTEESLQLNFQIELIRIIENIRREEYESD